MILSFWIYALLLCVLAVAFVLLPVLYRGREGRIAQQRDDRAELNRVIYQERSAELSTSLTAGDIDQQVYDQLSLELQRNLLDEAGSDDTQTAPLNGAQDSGSMGRSPWLLAALVPLFAIIAYGDFGLSWGAIVDLQLSKELRGGGEQTATSPHDTTGVNTTVEKLAERLRSQPENDEGWFLISQSYMRMGEFEKAAGAFKHLMDRYPNDAGLASWYTEALFLVDNRELTDRVSAAIDRTLALNPQDVSMLEIKAMNAFQNNDLAASLKWFRQAMDAGVEGERAELIQQAIDRLEEDLGVAGAESPSPSSSSTSTVAASPAASGLVDQEAVVQRRLEVLVEIAPGVQVDPQARVFVFARAMRGPPMPLAVQQMTVSALPRLVTLDGSMGMMAGMSLADFDQVQVVARISSTGIANVSPDDYQALSGAVDMTINNGVISLTLSQRVKDQ
ncbi:MAG: c-type cytochrome biogenesis protein CcmI [SAR86 cluster bacterium]|uniref:C-type cytochrome biogenesis protein CcmI n=1 Tax=SAR86 cluster bacterium TaxID=2030880 RepID=A0A972VTB7_9GAMM|nr:c-type cytochrome biogenesis protein CcmI [SAR86 cluster bacterium]